jgi:hypothetical protein
MRRNYALYRAASGSFGDWLSLAINRSRCDRFAVKFFQRAAGGRYLTQEELEEVQEQIRAYRDGEIDLVVREDNIGDDNVE